MQKKSIDTRQLIVMALFCALSFAATSLFRTFPPIVPATPWLKFDPKDALIAIGGMMYGPVSAELMIVVVAFIELFLGSETGLIGLLMNVLASSLFVLPSAILYRHRRALSSAIVGLAVGAVLATGGMLLWNWLITPLYMHIPRETIEPLLLTAFLPFNLFKTALNAILTVLLYKSVVSGLRAARLLPKAEKPSRRGLSVGVLLGCLFCLATLVLVFLVWRGIL